MDSSHYLANTVELPSLSVCPYAQYGIGLQKIIEDRMSAFLQILTRSRSGGRNGFIATGGFKFFFSGSKKVKNNTKI